jgi:ornithine cyclodeaminase/alanine dehydrogenase-like protein (mu-crystallin family)
VALAKVYSRSPERREAFAADMVTELGAEVVAVDSAEEAVADTDIVVTATNARTPVLEGAWLRPGVHVNAIGSNAASRQEIDVETVRRSAVVAADSLEQARIECGDLIAAARDDPGIWDRVTELGAVVAGRAAGRGDDRQITLFESQGLAMEDVVSMELLYRRAIAAGAGQEIALSREPVKIRR